jgi:hypothetical protein
MIASGCHRRGEGVGVRPGDGFGDGGRRVVGHRERPVERRIEREHEVGHALALLCRDSATGRLVRDAVVRHADARGRSVAGGNPGKMGAM